MTCLVKLKKTEGTGVKGGTCLQNGLETVRGEKSLFSVDVTGRVYSHERERKLYTKMKERHSQ